MVWRYGIGLKRRKAPQTRRLARLETIDFVEYLVVEAGFVQGPTIKMWV